MEIEELKRLFLRHLSDRVLEELLKTEQLHQFVDNYIEEKQLQSYKKSKTVIKIIKRITFDLYLNMHWSAEWSDISGPYYEPRSYETGFTREQKKYYSHKK